MKKILLLFISISLFSACQTEDVNVVNESSSEIILEESAKFIANPGTVESNVNYLNSCTGRFLNTVENIVDTSDWAVGDETGNIDFVLEDAFSCSSEFSICMIRLNGSPTNIYNVDFVLYDNGYYTIGPDGDAYVYDYLSNSISPSTAEELKQHFACEIKDYQNTYYAGLNSFISNVDFYEDSTLCTCPSGDSRILAASVTFLIY
jgi:hypothetical protein